MTSAIAQIEMLAEGLRSIYGNAIELTSALSMAKSVIGNLMQGGTTEDSTVYFGLGAPDAPGAQYKHKARVGNGLISG